MEEKPEQSAAADDKPKPNLCEECNSNASKYKCPGCSLRSCSLACVNSHKQRTACTGKRPLTNFVPISQFDDNQLVSDYNMLEDVKRIADSARRRRVTVCGYSHWLPNPLKNLRGAAASRRVKLLFLAKGMSKREKNKTYFNYRKKSISWTVEWRFHSSNSTDVVLLDHGIHEDSTLASALEKHLQPGPWNHQLRQFCDEDLDSLKLFMRKYPKGPKSPFVQLDINSPIRGQLSNTVILEYPVIHVFLPSHSCDFEVIVNAIPKKVETKEPPHHDCPSPKGVTFKEEEIEDEVSPDPIVSDLLSHGCERTVTGNLPKQSVNSSQANDTRTSAIEDGKMGSRSCIEELTDIPDLDFDFESGFIDVFPDLTADVINSDDFLDFDGILPEHKDVKDGEYLMKEEPEEGEYFMGEELEEGEIA